MKPPDIKKIKLSSIYFGWWSVLAGSILSLWGGTFYGNGFSAILIPVSSDLKIGRGTASVASGIGKILNGPQSVLTGRLSDKFGAKWIIVIGVLLMGLGLISMRYVFSLWAFFFSWGVLFGIGANCALGLPLDKFITDWFVRKRGRAMSIKNTSGGLGGTIILPLIAWLTTTQGWRETCFIGGLVMLGVCLPIVFFLIKPYRPEHYGWLPDGNAQTDNVVTPGRLASEGENIDFTLRQAVRTRAFWLLILAVSGLDLIIPTLSNHAIPILEDTGIDPVKAAIIVSFASVFAIVGTLASGFVADRVHKKNLRFLLMGAMFLICGGTGIFLLNQSIIAIYAWMILYGLGTGTFNNLIAFTRGHYFGRKNFGIIHGMSMILTPPFAAIAPIFAGWVYDKYHTYLPALGLISGLIAIFALALVFARPPKHNQLSRISNIS